MGKAGLFLIAVLLFFTYTSTSSASVKRDANYQLTIPSIFELFYFDNYRSQTNKMTITNNSVLGVRANTHWTLEGKVYSTLNKPININLNHSVNVISGLPNQNHNYQKIPVIVNQDISWQDQPGQYTLITILEINPSL